MDNRITLTITEGQLCDLIAMAHGYPEIFDDIGVILDSQKVRLTVDRDLMNAKGNMEPVHSWVFKIIISRQVKLVGFFGLLVAIKGISSYPLYGSLALFIGFIVLACVVLKDSLLRLREVHMRSNRRNMLRIYCQWLLTLISLNDIGSIRAQMQETADRIKSREHMLRLFLGHDEYKRFLKTMDTYTSALNIFSK